MTAVPFRAPAAPAAPAVGAAADFIFLAQVVRQHSAIVVDPTKEYLFTSRLGAVAREHGLDGIAGIVAGLRRQPHGPLKDAVVEAMTTNETSFFRDQAPFEAFRSILTDTITAGSTVGTVRVWCAACSSGQEPYSVALTSREVLAQHPGWRVSILASDISKAMVERVLNLDAPLPPLPRMDVVFLRNVLIYFDPGTKEQVLGRVAKVLRPGGYLLLGGAETTLGLSTPFERTMIGRAPVYRLPS